MMHYGTSYYPEQWPESSWSTDFALMRAAGMNVVRLGDFAWAYTQPDKETFDFDWLERAVDCAASFGLQVVLGTGTAAPPAWLTQAYPETLSVDRNGRRSHHGQRCHFNPVSPVYLKFCEQIADKLSRRFGTHSNVIGWQICNEYGPFSYDETLDRLFREFLQREFGTLEELNLRCGHAYWSQRYTDWSQITVNPEYHNPCLLASFRKMYTEVYRVYQANQLGALRRNAGEQQFITTNLHNRFSDGDPHVIGRDLDLVAYDNYLDAGERPGHLDHGQYGFTLDLARGIKGKKFWQMETQTGHVRYLPVNETVDRGETRRLIWHLASHGALAVMFWQWRPCLGGQEQFWGTIVGPGGQPRPLYDEIARVGAELKHLGPALDSADVDGSVAMLYSDQDRWAIDHERFSQQFDPFQHHQLYYRALRRAGQMVDVVQPLAALEHYRLVVAPHLQQITPELVAHLLAYVRGGGHLLLGARTGVKNRDGALLPESQPGSGFRQALGAVVREFYAVREPLALEGLDGLGTAQVWGEWLETEALDTEVLLKFGHGHSWLESQAAMVSRREGEGRITYLGTWPDASLMDAVIRWCHLQSPFKHAPLSLPSTLEFNRLGSATHETVVAINHGSSAYRLPLDQGWSIQMGSLELPANEVGVFSRAR